MNDQDCLWSVTLASGLKVAFFIREVHEAAAVLRVNFGAKDRILVTPAGEMKLPAGVAHFLEHKTFTLADGSDAGLAFDRLGLMVNAQTGYEATEYYFNGSAHLEEGLDLLLSFVLGSPSFTKENVAREREIIAGEIAMYDDDPQTVLFNSLARRLFQDYYLVDDIAGTKESIKMITAEMLETVHHAAYVPSNMTLALYGLPASFGFTSSLEMSAKLNEKINACIARYACYARSNACAHFVPSIIYRPEEGEGDGPSLIPFTIALPLSIFGMRLDVTNLSIAKKYRAMEILDALAHTLMGIASPLALKLRAEGSVIGKMNIETDFDEHYLKLAVIATTPYPEKFQEKTAAVWRELTLSTLDLELFRAYLKMNVGLEFSERDRSLDFAFTLAERLALGMPLLVDLKASAVTNEEEVASLLKQLTQAIKAFVTLVPRK